MRKRVIFLVFLLSIRFALGFFESQKYREGARVKVTGNIDKTYQNTSNCVIKIGRFLVDYRSDCSFSRSGVYVVFGRVGGSVIDRVLGRLWLNSAKITVTDEQINFRKTKVDILSSLALVREKIVDRYRRYLSVPESGLVAGIVLGDKNDMGYEFYQQMVKSGTVHIAVASGYNVMLVGGTVLSWCFWIWKRKIATIVAIGVMLFYAGLAGGEPPVMRAVVMAGLVYVAAALGRKVISWWLLMVAGWLMLLVDPGLLLSVGFQLSISASVGLIVVEPVIGRWLERKAGLIHGPLAGSGLLTTISTMLMTAPIIWWHFGRVSMIGILSNILILPLVPFLMILGVLMLVLPGLFFGPVYILAHWMVLVIRFFGVS